MLKRFGLENANSVSTPADTNVKLQKEDGVSNSVDSGLYKSIIGSLLYASVGTRPDIAQAVSTLAKFCANPTEAHLTAAKRVLRYLKGTRNVALKFEKTGSSSLIGYSDADWAGDIDDRHSTTGIVFTMAGCSISWPSKKQATVALSTTEAEYVALSAAVQEAVWLRKVLSDLNLPMSEPTTLREDNQGAIAMTKNPIAHGRTKHIDIRYHYVKEAVENGVISLEYCSTEDMLADILTKPLPKHKFENLRKRIGLSEFRCQ